MFFKNLLVLLAALYATNVVLAGVVYITKTQAPVFVQVTKVRTVYAPKPTPVQPPIDPNTSLMFSLVNNLRAQNGLSPFYLDNSLMGVSQAQATYMASIGQMTHDSPYPDLQSRFAASGATCNGCAENVAWGLNDVQSAFNAWVNSPEHLANMLGNYRSMGWAVVNKYWAQDFNA
ncbi:hypothetical protein BB559_004726 [Furculomyces boomerangus]|uniref:SCP domain-containing protein n=2 Tax=Harpellales TaxID=61421 RepID=A0A2T9YD49_9FUNG|nr:hypothetical protein BB559_004726 [Furculomyces boomerangus]PWA02304.1 hypothetical protein BB558_001560 [Smittium angustum]PWA02439.1 hypothetical protein BB558_001414 [Smittium angustum]